MAVIRTFSNDNSGFNATDGSPVALIMTMTSLIAFVVLYFGRKKIATPVTGKIQQVDTVTH
jgi:hypothetical protein